MSIRQIQAPNELGRSIKYGSQEAIEQQQKDRIYANVPESYQKMREQNLALLSGHGFQCALALPIKTRAALRPVSGIAHRLMAL